ncbi:acyl-CoA N-acyltransferase [Coccomyxa subellipsoidea C-169]|uniref:Acyl-CoA N-acyltransferase n=1 Tax=Coccomyxa subellipsoidea (strain C-169) TaxID=574566 RepID=I0YIA6_COCSC|nr:acyl-CoA N-acyltransferase [Coccomyxa subellipsoidea C-169]EIE18125.1 acyl-CoA N-acyltransferase [Coccomyxa subellipsoidea C-169]|eukprot:XP_005642669.1 acyl-CoA N-acyltransferase [Coccomyxa subellipsoidea C-169]
MHRVVGTAAVTFAEEEDVEDVRNVPLLPADSAHLTNMAVDGKLRNQGIARLLLAACEDHARQIGCSSITLAVHVNNTPAQKLYMSAGYDQAKSRQPKAPLFMLPGRRWQHSIMRKSLLQ